MKKKSYAAKGFTIIEVIIVLAIASLLITGVMIAAANASKSGRDTRRRADTQAFASAIDQWASNHSGILPHLSGDGSSIIDIGTGFGIPDAASPFFAQKYIDLSKFKDPKSSTNYFLISVTAAPTCSSTGSPPSSPGGSTGAFIHYWRIDNRQYKLYTCLESGMYTYDPS